MDSNKVFIYTVARSVVPHGDNLVLHRAQAVETPNRVSLFLPPHLDGYFRRMHFHPLCAHRTPEEALESWKACQRERINLLEQQLTEARSNLERAERVLIEPDWSDKESS